MLRVLVGAARDGLLPSALKPHLDCIIIKGILGNTGAAYRGYPGVVLHHCMRLAAHKTGG